MDKYTPEERAEIVTIFIENNRSIIATQRKLRQKYPNRPVPHKTTIYRLHANFRQYGTTADRPRSGRQRTSRNAENVALVRDSVAESPETSIRRRGSQLHISARSLRRILKTDLKMVIDRSIITMTSTKFNVGLSNSQSSSRVLKPPGGGHTNIFGADSIDNREEILQKKNVRNQKTEIMDCFQMDEPTRKDIEIEPKSNENHKKIK